MLYKMLEYYKFPIKFIILLKKLLENTIFTVIVNSCSTKSIKYNNGLKQGDPLSPLLFTIYTNLLNIIVNNNKDITGFLFALFLNYLY